MRVHCHQVLYNVSTFFVPSDLIGKSDFLDNLSSTYMDGVFIILIYFKCVQLEFTNNGQWFFKIFQPKMIQSANWLLLCCNYLLLLLLFIKQASAPLGVKF